MKERFGLHEGKPCIAPGDPAIQWGFLHPEVRKYYPTVFPTAAGVSGAQRSTSEAGFASGIASKPTAEQSGSGDSNMTSPPPLASESEGEDWLL